MNLSVNPPIAIAIFIPHLSANSGLIPGIGSGAAAYEHEPDDAETDVEHVPHTSRRRTSD
jgi:hypothetical protein